MSDQEINDRDETRRLAYIVLAAGNPKVREVRLHEVVGTLAHALTHHGAGDRTAVSGSYVLDQLITVMFGGRSEVSEAEARRWLKGEIDRLGSDIEVIKGRLVNPQDVEAIPDTPRRAFMRVVYGVLDRVANDPEGQWFHDSSSGDTMHEVEVALDAYAGFLGRLGRGSWDAGGPQAEVDLAQALDLLGRLMRRPGVDVSVTAQWVAQARARQADRTP